MKKDELEAYYRLIYKSLFLYALSLTHNREDAEDLVSEAFVKAYLSFRSGNFKAWIYKVVLNEYLNMKKKKERLDQNPEKALEKAASTENILNDVIGKEERRALYQAIYRLKDSEKNVILLSIDQELDDRQIAGILGISVDNVRVTRHRAKQNLLKIINGGNMNG